MIPQAAITEWGRTVPWPTVEQIEQHLVLSRLIVEIADDDYLGDELVFRGGTCLLKLHPPEPLRYSEDLDYVRSTGGGIRELTRAVTRIGERLGMEVRTRITEHPKMFLRAPRDGWRPDASQGRGQHVRALTCQPTHPGPVRCRVLLVQRQCRGAHVHSR